MPNVQERPIAYERLYESALIKISGYHCNAPKSSAGDEELSENNSIVILRHGSFAKHFRKRNVFADVNQAVFFSKKSVYRISHPTDHGDRGTYFWVAPNVLNEMIREFDPTIDEHPDQPFPFITALCNTRLFWQHLNLVWRLESEKEVPLEPLWVDVSVLQWIAEVLGGAFEQHCQPSKSRRISTKIDHAEKAQAAKAFLASHLSEQVTLNDMAREVAVSPFNLARIFQQQTGLPVHRYLTLLRLRASLERLSDSDLTKLALDLGFSSHSHFTDMFRREFGRTPSEARKNTTASKLKKISKNLIVS